MYRHQSQILIQYSRLVRQISVVVARSYATKRTKSPPIKSSTELTIAFFSKNIGCDYWKCQQILQKHPELKALKGKDVINSMSALKRLKYSAEDVLTKPTILYNSEITLENRYIVLKECGFELVNISLLSKYVAAMNRSVATLKSMGHIPFDMNVVERLRECFTDIDLELKSQYPCNENLDLKILRQHVTNCYLQQRLDMSAGELEKLWIVYNRIRHKSYEFTQKMVKILLEDLQFSKERIRKNAFLLYSDANNVRRILNEIPTIDGQDIKNILYRRPKIMMSSCDALISTLQHVKDFGIGENAVLRCLEVLTLGPDTVLDRLKDLNEIEEFQLLITNPRVLRLVHYQKKARMRLDYLSQLKVRCVSLHILSCGSKAFAKFARDGCDRTKGRDIVLYLSNVMDKPEEDLRELFSRHPNWCHIAPLHVKQCYDYLISKNFTIEEVYNNIYLLLYPIKHIGKKLEQVYSPGFCDEVHILKQQLSNNEILTLVLYLIEREFHFTGDGIWTEQHTLPVENFNNLLPDFPESRNKIYKYGVKPSSATSTGLVPSPDYVLN